MGKRKDLILHYDTTREAVVMRDNGKCVKCGKPYADVHEILSRSMWATTDSDMALCFSVKNRVCLCREHHAYYQGNPYRIRDLLLLLKLKFNYDYTECEFQRYLEVEYSETI